MIRKLPRETGIFALGMALAIIFAGCMRHQEVIVVDGWWDDDYAKEACRAASANQSLGTTPCIRNSKEMVFELEKAFASGFQENPSCSDLQLYRGFRNPSDTKSADILKNARWTIQLNIAVRNGELYPTDSTWQISDDVKSLDAKSFAKMRYADGDLRNPYDAAGKVCHMVKGKGGQELPTP